MTQTLGKYELRRVLGRGAAGIVYEAWDPAIARTVAIKTVPVGGEGDADAREQLDRFRREAQAAGGLTHPNIVGIFDFGETDAVCYIVMEYVDGEPLKALLDRGERLPLADVLRIMGDLLAGLGFSHARGVVHRDIKPANLMLNRERRLKIADFGIARVESSELTSVGTMLGTPAYMAPEQFIGTAIDQRTDLYAAGVVLYQLLTGVRPYEGSLTVIMHKVLNVAPPRPSEMAAVAYPAFDEVVATAMAKRPEDRFPDAAAFMAALSAAAAEQPAPVAQDEEATVAIAAPAPPAPVPPAAPVPSRDVRRSALPVGLAAVLAALVVAGGGGWLLLKPASPPPRTQPPARTAVFPPAVSAAASAPAATRQAAPPPAAQNNPSPAQPTARSAPLPAAPPRQQVAIAVPKASPAPVRPPPDWRPAVLRAVESLPCALVTPVSDAEGAPLKLRAVLPEPEFGRLQQAADAAAPAGKVAWDIAELPDRTYCPALNLLSGIAGGAPMNVSLVGDAGVLRANDLIQAKVRMPAFPARLLLEYFSGPDVFHVPVSSSAQGLLHPDQTVLPGTKGDGKIGQVGAPYGTDLLVAIASSAPLQVSRALNQQEPAADYLRRLQQAIADAHRNGAALSAAAVPITTAP